MLDVRERFRLLFYVVGLAATENELQHLFDVSSRLRGRLGVWANSNTSHESDMISKYVALGSVRNLAHGGLIAAVGSRCHAYCCSLLLIPIGMLCDVHVSL